MQHITFIHLNGGGLGTHFRRTSDTDSWRANWVDMGDILKDLDEGLRQLGNGRCL